jgi:hypothetical protein
MVVDQEKSKKNNFSQKENHQMINLHERRKEKLELNQF